MNILDDILEVDLSLNQGLSEMILQFFFFQLLTSNTEATFSKLFIQSALPTWILAKQLISSPKLTQTNKTLHIGLKISFSS